jgi:hypothetical protein
MGYSFGSIKFGMMIGIGGGVPSAKHDIRLGDVVVGKPRGTSGGVVQYDFGKTTKDGIFRLSKCAANSSVGRIEQPKIKT